MLALEMYNINAAKEGSDMPQAVIHFLVIERALKTTLPTLWKEQYTSAGLGSYAPDMFYAKNGNIGKEPFFGKLADKMHSSGLLPFFCQMLDEVKETANLEEKTVLKAFVYGYLSHMLTDNVFHPFVYRKTCDHWLTHLPDENHTKHTKMENFLDYFLLADNAAQTDLSRARNFFHKQAVLLPLQIYNILNKALNDTYGFLYKHDSNDKKTFNHYFAEIPPANAEHPIQEAFIIYRNNFNMLYKFDSALPPIEETDKSLWTNAQQLPWYPIPSNEKLKYSVMDLFHLAITATINAIQESETFLNSTLNNSRIFFNLR